MYEIYETKAYVLKTIMRKESDQRVLLFSKDFGLIWADVSGSKKESSKMRNFLQDLTYANFCLVQGKTGYRVTGGKFIENIFFDLQKNQDENLLRKVQSIKNIFVLFEKIFHKDEKDEKVFNLLERLFEDLKEKSNEKKIEEKEVVFLSKVFFILGYLDKKDLLQESEVSTKKIISLRKKVNENISKITF